MGAMSMSRWFGGVVLLVLLAIQVPAARAQILVKDDTGGVAPQAVFCPSTGAGCFTSRQAAAAALRAATPDVGYLLEEELNLTPSSTIFYHVPDQAPVSYGASLYGIDYDGVIGGDGYCPQSLAN